MKSVRILTLDRPICSHSVNRLSLRQLMRNPLRANFSELQVIFEYGMHGAMANVDLNTNLFLCDSSVFPDQTNNPLNNIMAQWTCPWCESFCSGVRPSPKLFWRSCTLLRDIHVFAIHSRHATMNFACSSTLSHQEANQTSFLLCLLTFPMLDEHTLH